MANHPEPIAIFVELCTISRFALKILHSSLLYIHGVIFVFGGGSDSFPDNKSLTRRVMLRALRYTQQTPNLLKYFSTIARDDPIHRVNLRVGKVVNVEKHPGGEHLFIEQGAITHRYHASITNSKCI